MKMSRYSGEQLAQVDNPDPFAPPVWRSPVYHTPGWVITLVQLARLADRRWSGSWPGIRCWTWSPPSWAWSWSLAGWPGPVTLTATVAALLTAWRCALASVVLPVHRPPGPGQVAPAGITSGTGWRC